MINVKFCTHAHIHTLYSCVCNSLASSCFRFLYGKLVTNSTDCCFWLGKHFSIWLYPFNWFGLECLDWTFPFMLRKLSIQKSLDICIILSIALLEVRGTQPMFFKLFSVFIYFFVKTYYLEKSISSCFDYIFLTGCFD